jgi:hypothetical protein
VLVALMVSAGCGGDGAPSEAALASTSAAPVTAPTATTPTTATATPSPTETTAAPPAGLTVNIVCYDDDYEEVTFTSPAEAWPGRYDYCLDTTVAGDPSPKEEKAVQVAYGRRADFDSYSTLYGICAENHRGQFNYLRSAGGANQIRELTGAFMLCPHHPNRAQAARYLDAAKAELVLERQGRLFTDGTFRVGKAIQPGTYVARGDLEGCYWERTNRNGGTIDNYFTMSATRVQVTIAASDYTFTSDGCGEWKPAT